MDRKEDYIKSMEFCQAIIARMARNSFFLKQWFLLAITAIITAFSKFIFFEELNYKFNIDHLFFLMPLFVFPCLDAYYLKQERIFREIYNDFMNCINKKEIIRNPFDMKPTKEQRTQFSMCNVIFSISICLIAGKDKIVYKGEKTKEELWEKYYIQAPAQRRQPVKRYKIVRRA